MAVNLEGNDMDSRRVAELIEAGIAGSRATVSSADNVHFEAVVVAAAFAGRRSVQRHQLVYAALGPAMAADIHALALQVYTPEEFAGLSRG